MESLSSGAQGRLDHPGQGQLTSPRGPEPGSAAALPRPRPAQPAALPRFPAGPRSRGRGVAAHAVAVPPGHPPGRRRRTRGRRK